MVSFLTYARSAFRGAPLIGANVALLAVNSGVRVYKAALGMLYHEPYVAELAEVGADGSWTPWLARQERPDHPRVKSGPVGTDARGIFYLRYWSPARKRYVERALPAAEFEKGVIGLPLKDAVAALERDEARVAAGHGILSVSSRSGRVITDRVVLGDLFRAGATGDAVSAVMKKGSSHSERLTVCSTDLDFYRLDCDASLAAELPEIA